MCFAVYIGTNRELETGKFVPNETDIYFYKPTKQEENSLRPKFTKRNIYHVGSDTSCSCGLAFDSDDYDEPEEEQANKKSPAKFIEVLREWTCTEDIEYYCCWEGDWDLPTEHNRQIDIADVSLDKNYFGLVEKEFILFRKQNPN